MFALVKLRQDIILVIVKLRFVGIGEPLWLSVKVVKIRRKKIKKNKNVCFGHAKNTL
jgi:hypothetical protein